MNCKDVRENLSMYIDDMLDKQIRTLVEEHLAVCEACRQEHESLVRVIEELKVAGTMKAPEGFLETLHERLDEPSYWERIKELLFVPAQIKIPLEFAALSVVAVLVFTVYSLYMPGDQMVFTMKDASVGKTVSAPVVHEAEALKQDALPQTEIAADTDYVEAVKPQAVELALVLVKEPAAAGRAGTYSATRALSEEKGVSAHQAKLSRALPKAEAPAEKSTDAADELKEDLPEPALREQEGAPGTDRAFFKENESVRRILDLIGLSGGRVLSEETDSAGSGDLIVVSEIPSGQYGAFMEKLAGIAELKDPPPQVAEDNKGSIIVKMRLMRN